MPGVIAAPEVMASAATDLATIVSNVSAAHAAAALPTAAVLSAAKDEVSTGVAHVFSQYGLDYQALAGQATAFHDQFVQHLSASAKAYAGAEAGNVASLQPLNAVADSIGGLGIKRLASSIPCTARYSTGSTTSRVYWPMCLSVSSSYCSSRSSSRSFS